MNYIIFDLEATCFDDRDFQKQNREIIEIGTIKINEKGMIIDSFDSFIKPIKTTLLTKFCKELTSISQEDVDTAKSFKEIIKAFKNWIGKDYNLCSWGFFDKDQLIRDCLLHNLDTSWIKNHISLKHQYPNVTSFKWTSKPKSLYEVLIKENLAFEGTKHRGIDDAKNIAKIFIKYQNGWQELSKNKKRTL